MATPHIDPGEIAALKRLAAGIMNVQGNRFIKDLLRSKNIRIGNNKEEFKVNLEGAIDAGQITSADVAQWLNSVEGWGNQHVYLFNISTTLRKELTEPKIHQRVIDSGLAPLWEADTTFAFPDQPTLTSISYIDSILRIVWHESSPGWVRAPEKDIPPKDEGLDVFEYRAYRKVERRAITRFEAHVKPGIAGLFIADPIEGDEHQKAIIEAKRVIALLTNLKALEKGEMDIGSISRNLDQKNVPKNNLAPAVKTQRSRLSSGAAYVEFAANSSGKAYWEEPAIQDVRKSVRAEQLQAFQGAEGVFIFQETKEGLDRPLRVQLYGKDNRIRLWAQMEAFEVWNILTQLSQYQ